MCPKFNNGICDIAGIEPEYVGDVCNLRRKIAVYLSQNQHEQFQTNLTLP